MKLTFSVNYRTEWGESLWLTGSAPSLAEGVPMHLDGQETWTAVVEIPEDEAPFTYAYEVRHDNGGVKKEWGHPRTFRKADGTHRVYIYDRWQDQPWDKPYYAISFTDCICRREEREPRQLPAPGMLTLSVDAPMVAPDEAVAVSGDVEELGAWLPEKALRMSDADYPTWSVDIPLSALREGMDYKFLIVKKATGAVVAWEGRDNRHLDPIEVKESDTVIDAGQRLVNPLAPWRGAGVAIPVFSLRSDEDFGVGDFMDLKGMIDWAVQTHQQFVQLLPVNDTTMTGTWTDSYPYNANSTFALHPMYLRLVYHGASQ